MSIVDKLAIHRGIRSNSQGSAVVWLRREFLQGTVVIYPSARDIEEYFVRLPAEWLRTKLTLFWRRRTDRITGRRPAAGAVEDKRIEVLRSSLPTYSKHGPPSDCGTAPATSRRSAAAISLEGGEAELGFWYAHRLYNLVREAQELGHTGTGRFNPTSRIGSRRRENLWYNPDLVPKGWEEVSCTHLRATRLKRPADRTILEGRS